MIADLAIFLLGAHVSAETCCIGEELFSRISIALKELCVCAPIL